MCKTRPVKFDKLLPEQKSLIQQKFRDGISDRNRRMIFPDGTAWILQPEGVSASKLSKAVMFIKRVHKPRAMFLTMVPESFIKGAAA